MTRTQKIVRLVATVVLAVATAAFTESPSSIGAAMGECGYNCYTQMQQCPDQSWLDGFCAGSCSQPTIAGCAAQFGSCTGIVIGCNVVE